MMNQETLLKWSDLMSEEVKRLTDEAVKSNDVELMKGHLGKIDGINFALRTFNELL